MSALEIRLLGEFLFRADGHVLTGFESPRLQTLVAYLLLHPHVPQSRQQIAFLLFPDSGEAQARTNLRKQIHFLRQLIPNANNFLLVDTQTLQWNPHSTFTLDVAAFENALASANSTESLRAAVNLYRGELLPGNYDDWVLGEREQLQQKFVSALEQLVRTLQDEHEYRAALNYAQRLLRVDPLREETYRELIRLHKLVGDRAGALRVYQSCVNVLGRELGVEVSAETRRALEENNIAAFVSAAPTRVGNLPIQGTSFIGREKELAELREVLNARAPRLLTLTGAGGTGKTRLVIQIANELSEQFSDGAWFIDLAALSGASDILSKLAGIFNVREQTNRALIETLTEILRAKQLLLIFDNCEHLHDACSEIITALVPRCPRVQFLATSRARLNIKGEHVWITPPLALPDTRSSTPSELIRADSVQLYVERALQVLPTFSLTARNANPVAQICARLDGIALAIELAASRANMLTPAQIAARLDDAFTLLTRGNSSASGRHQTLRAAMEWSYALLSEQEKVLFRRLAVFVGGFTLEAAEAICADEQRDDSRDSIFLSRARVLDVLSDLVDKSLVAVVHLEHAEMVRYRFLEPIRQFATEKLLALGEQEILRMRHLDFYLQFAEVSGVQTIQSLERLEAEHDNLRAAMRFARRDRQHGEEFLRVTSALEDFWDARGHFSEAREWLGAATALADEDVSLRATIHYAKAVRASGFMAFRQSDLKTAQAYLDAALHRFQYLEDTAESAQTYGYLALVAWRQNDYALARELYEKRLDHLRTLGDKNEIGKTLNNLGILDYEQGDYTTARVHYTESLTLLREVGNLVSTARTMANLGNAAVAQGEYDEAEKLFEASLALKQELGMALDIANQKVNMGMFYVMRGDCDKARDFCTDALASSRKLGAQTHVESALIGLGLVARCQNNFADARSDFLEALWISKTIGSKFRVAVALEELAGLAAMQGQSKRAALLFGAAETILELIRALPEPFDRIRYHQDIALAREKLGHAEFENSWNQGRALSMEQAIELAMII